MAFVKQENIQQEHEKIEKHEQEDLNNWLYRECESAPSQKQIYNIMYLIINGADVNHVITREKFNQTSPDNKYIYTRTPLWIACSWGNFYAVKILLEQNCEKSLQEKCSRHTCLEAATYYNKNGEFQKKGLDWFLACCASVNDQGNNRRGILKDIHAKLLPDEGFVTNKENILQNILKVVVNPENEDDVKNSYDNLQYYIKLVTVFVLYENSESYFTISQQCIDNAQEWESELGKSEMKLFFENVQLGINQQLP